MAPVTSPCTIKRSQASAFIFPIADLCTVLLAALTAIYGPGIVYAIIYVILGETSLSFHPEEGIYDGVVIYGYVVLADAADALAQGAMRTRTRIELCAESYPFNARGMIGSPTSLSTLRFRPATSASRYSLWFRFDIIDFTIGYAVWAIVRFAMISLCVNGKSEGR